MPGDVMRGGVARRRIRLERRVPSNVGSVHLTGCHPGVRPPTLRIRWKREGEATTMEKRTGSEPDRMQEIISLCKRRGYIFPSSEIYGGLNAVFDYGPLGVELKNNIKRAWWDALTRMRDDIVGLDAGILMARRVWQASGHEEVFTDPLVDCTNCKSRFRADHVEEM